MVINGNRFSRPSDPAKEVRGAAPNFGRPVFPQIITFAGITGMIAKTYRSPDEAVKHSLENARFMRNDCAVMECLEARQRGTALLNWHLEPEDPKDKRQKDLCEDLTAIVERVRNFTEYRRNLLEAIWYGRYAVQHRYEWGWVKGQRRLVMRRWEPINGDKLVFRYYDGTGDYDPDQIGVRVSVSSPSASRDSIAGHRKLTATDSGMAYFLEPWERSLIAVHRHMVEDGSYEDVLSAGRIHGVGIRDRIYWTWYQKQETMAHLMEVIERTGTGFTIYYYPWGNKAAEDKMREVAETQTRNNVLLIPRMEEDQSTDAFGIDRIEPSTGGIETLKGIVHDLLGHQIKRYILGQTLSSEAGSTGLGSGVADLHAETASRIIEYDAANLEETLTDELVEPLKRFNFPWATSINVRFKIDVKENEAAEKLQAYKSAWDMGAKLKASDVMDLIGASVPTQDDEVLQNPAMVQQARLWEQTHPDANGMAGGAENPAADMPQGDLPEHPEGSVEDLFGPLAAELQEAA